MTEIKKQEKNKVFFDLTVPHEEIKEAELKVYKRNKNYFNVPGFRKGHVPTKIVEQFYGEGIFFEDALN
ncbi:MAG: trigger factor family protein, partial [Aedoeadaptatus pacaensis]